MRESPSRKATLLKPGTPVISTAPSVFTRLAATACSKREWSATTTGFAASTVVTFPIISAKVFATAGCSSIARIATLGILVSKTEFVN